jgi:hypothetical protein
MTCGSFGLIEPYLSGYDIAGNNVAKNVVVLELADGELLLSSPLAVIRHKRGIKDLRSWSLLKAMVVERDRTRCVTLQFDAKEQEPTFLDRPSRQIYIGASPVRGCNFETL